MTEAKTTYMACCDGCGSKSPIFQTELEAANWIEGVGWHVGAKTVCDTCANLVRRLGDALPAILAALVELDRQREQVQKDIPF